MSKRKNIFFLLLVFSSELLASNSIFRSDDYNFRFRYPAEWKVESGEGKNVKAKVVASDGTNCNVVVRFIPELKENTNKEVMTGFTKYDLLSGIKAKFSDANLLDGGETFVDNRRAVYAYVDYSYGTLKANLNFRSLMVYTFDRGYFYAITCGTEKSLFKSNRANFENLVSSFVFEDW